MPFLHDHTQCEKLQKLESELEDLINEREELENAWISTINSSREEQKDKLEEVRNKPQENRILQLIHDAYKHEMSKKDEVEKVNQQLKSMQMELKKRHPELAGLIVCKEKQEKQVMQPTLGC